MRKLGWFVVSAAVAALVLCGALLLAANLYVQSQGAQQRIRQTLADVLHVPVTLKKTTVTPWEGLRLDGIILQPPLADTAPRPSTHDFMSVDSFRVRVAWWPLLTQRRVQIESILLDHPRLSWAQSAGGRWIWPAQPVLERQHAGLASARVEAQPPVDQSGKLAAGSPQPVPAATRLPEVRDRAQVAATDSEAAVAQSETADVPRFRVRHGSLELLNVHRRLLGHLEEVDLDGQLRDGSHAEGELRFQRAALARPGLRLTDFRSAFLFDEARGLSLDGGKGSLAGGELQTTYRLSTQDAGSPFTADCQVDHVELSELLRQAGSHLRLLDGRLQGSVHLEGSSGNPEERHATGQLRLIGAAVRNFPLLELLGEMLRIKDLSHLQFKEAQLDCRLDGEDLQIAPLSLVSNDLQIQARGRYATDTDRIDLHGRLIIDPAIGRQLPEFIEMNFTPCDGANAAGLGCRYIDFDVTGPLSRPSTNLFDRVLAGPSNGLLQNLLAPKPKKARGKSPKPPAWSSDSAGEDF